MTNGADVQVDEPTCAEPVTKVWPWCCIGLVLRTADSSSLLKHLKNGNASACSKIVGNQQSLKSKDC